MTEQASEGVPGEHPPVDDLTELQFVGEHTASVLRSAGIEAADIRRRQVAYDRLLEAGANPGVAAKLRREYSLSWSFTASGDVVRRSRQVNGLDEREAAWIAQSNGEWIDAIENRTANGARGETANSPTVNGSNGSYTDRSSATRDRPPHPTPLSALEELSPGAIDRLADAGITSVRRLATIEPAPVADALDVDRSEVERWRDFACEHPDTPGRFRSDTGRFRTS